MPEVIVPTAGRRAARVTMVGGLVAALLILGASAAFADAPSWSAGANPYGVAASRDGKTVYVVNTGGAYLGAIDTGTGVQRRNSSQSFAAPKEVAVSPDGATAYVTSVVAANSTGFLIPVDTASLTNLTPIQVGSNPWPVVTSPNGTSIYVGNRDDNSISVIDGGSRNVVKTISVGSDPFALAVSPEGDNLYVANRGSDSVSVISTGSQSVEKTINVGDGPSGIAVGANGKQVVTSNRNNGTLSIIDRSSSNVSTFSIGGSPFGIAIGRDSNIAYVTNADSSNTVTVVDLGAQRVVGHVKLSGQSNRIVASTKDDRVFVSLSPGGAVAVIAYPFASAPADQTVAAGKKATFTSVVTNKPDSISWQLSADGGTTWHNMTDGNLAQISFAATTAESGNLYRLALIDADFGNSFSQAAKLTVTGSDSGSGSGSGSGSQGDSESSSPTDPDASGSPTGSALDGSQVSSNGSLSPLIPILLGVAVLILIAIIVILIIVLRRRPGPKSTQQ